MNILKKIKGLHLIVVTIVFTINGHIMLAAEAETKKQISDAQKKHYNHKKFVAAGGYDVVAYFQAGKGTSGKKSLSYKYGALTYYFSNEKNRQLFIKNPQKYEPQYGGWCAYAMAVSGDKVKINPKTFKIHDGKLYLFYNALIGGNTLKKWNRGDDKIQIDQANKYWKNLTQ